MHCSRCCKYEDACVKPINDAQTHSRQREVARQTGISRTVWARVDILTSFSTLSVMLLFSFLTVTLRLVSLRTAALIQRNDFKVCWLHIQQLVTSPQKCAVWRTTAAILTNVDTNLAEKQQKVQVDVFMRHPVGACCFLVSCHYDDVFCWLIRVQRALYVMQV